VQIARGNATGKAMAARLWQRLADYQAANDIIVKLGAAVDTPIKSPSKQVLFIVTLVITLIAALAVLNWK
jgi:hypothetical protein